jgi:hypothetical protein
MLVVGTGVIVTLADDAPAGIEKVGGGSPDPEAGAV